MVYQLLRSVLDRELAQAAVEEMRAAWAEAKADKSMVCYLREDLRPAGSSRPEFLCGQAVEQLKSVAQALLEENFPGEAEGQTEERMGWPQTFNTITVNRNWATPLHRDTGTQPGSISALTVVKIGEVNCPTEFRDPETERTWEEELETGDVALYPGAEMEHGNPRGMLGTGERWAFVFYRG